MRGKALTRRREGMVRSLLHRYLVKAILIALMALVLFGVFPGTELAIILILFVALRSVSLVAEALRKPIAPERLATIISELTRNYENLTSTERSAKALALGFSPDLSARELAETQVNGISHSHQAQRSKQELGAEALGLLAFAVLAPLNVALYTSDIVSLRTGQGWEGVIVAVICLALYAWPHRGLKGPTFSRLRILWWALPFPLGLVLMSRGVETRHPYLNPFNPNSDRLAAERVLSLKNNVVAGRYADWVLRYARQLDQQGQSQRAVHFYREALQLDANDHQAYARLAALEAQLSGLTEQPVARPAVASRAPYWTVGESVPQSPRRPIGSDLENIQCCTVVLVPVGGVPDRILDAIAYVIHRELDLPVCVSPNPVPLTPRTRVRGLVTGPQWDQAALVGSFTNSTKSFPNAPVKYVLVTPVDIYLEEANYVFSASYEWGALISYARFGEPDGKDSPVLQRAAKQALCAVLKSFKVPMSPDRDCVTSYSRSLEEFDAKGDRPTAPTLKLFRQAVTDTDRKWQTRPMGSRGSI